MSIPDPREDAAVDALITASLHLANREVSDEDIEVFLKNRPQLSPEVEAELEKWNPDLFARSDEVCAPTDEPISEISTELYGAMNRKNAKDERSAEAEAELQRRRKEALERLKKKRRSKDK